MVGEKDYIQISKNRFLEQIDSYGSDPYGLKSHVPEAEKWAIKIQKNHPEADIEIIRIAIWLHDIGHYPKDDIDHAVKSERIARDFLTSEGYPHGKMERVLHCVRSHRCSDVLPDTIEGKIVACADSASHFTDTIYFDMTREDKRQKRMFKVFAKLERDLRDISVFPEVYEDLKGMYDGWKLLFESYEKIDLNLDD